MRKMVVTKSKDFSETIDMALGYVRVSKENKNNVANQVARLVRFFSENGISNYAIFIDVDYAGNNAAKPALKEALRLVSEGKAGMLVTADLSRMSRIASNAVSIVDQVIDAGTRLILLDEGIDTADGIDKKEISKYAEYAEFYSVMISGKISAALAIKVEEGIPLYHGGPYGYKADPHDKHKLILDSEAAENVRYIFTKYCELKSTTTVAKIMTEKRVPNPSTYRRLKNGTLTETELTPNDYIWGAATIYSILTNVLYTGDSECLTHSRYFDKKFIPNTHEAIINKALFAEVQAILKH